MISQKQKIAVLISGIILLIFGVRFLAESGIFTKDHSLVVRPSYIKTVSVARASANKDGVHFGGELPEQQPWGPQGFTFDKNGDLWIADSVAHRAIKVDDNGEIMQVIDASNVARTITYAVPGNDWIALLDISNIPPKIHFYSYEGAFLASTNIPEGWAGSVAGMSTDSSGDIFVEQSGGINRYRISLDEKYQGTIERVASLYSEQAPEGFTENGGAIQPIESGFTIGSFHLLEIAKDGATYWYSEEYRNNEDGTLSVNVVVRRFGKSGDLERYMVIPFSDRYTFVDEQGIVIFPDEQEVWFMLTKKDGVEIKQLEWRKIY